MKVRDHIPGILKNLQEPESLCLFFSILSQDEMDKVDRLLRKLPNPPKKLIAFVLNRADNLTDVVTNKSIFCFELTDFNIFGKKSDLIEQKFSDNHFDLLISFADTQDMVAQKLVAEINASFKVGAENPNNSVIFDLIIDYKIKDDYQGYYKQVMHYLSVLNITTK